MIIGNGSIASLLNDRKWVLFYAAGASNSQHVSEEQVIRESITLGSAMGQAAVNDMMFVYFSSISIFTKDSDYTRHKKQMEDIIRRTAEMYTIIRIGNIWECTNPHTFINAYKTKPYEPRDEYRYMISKEQLNFITDNLPTTGKHEISIFGEALKISECLNRIK